MDRQSSENQNKKRNLHIAVFLAPVIVAPVVAVFYGLVSMGAIVGNYVWIGFLAGIASSLVLLPLLRSTTAKTDREILSYEKYRRELERLRLVEEDLQITNRELTKLINNTPDILYVLDPEGVITFVNDAVLSYGHQRNELIGKNILDFVHPDDADKTAKAIEARRL